MLLIIIWWSGIILEMLILLRAWQQESFAKYPFFYLYVASLLLADGSLYIVSLVNPVAYAKWNWAAGFVNIILGSGILLEIFKHCLAPYAGAERLARICFLSIFGLLFSFGIVYLIFAPSASHSGTEIPRNLERSLLSVQALFLSALVAVIFYYGIAVGRNIQGMIVGYGACVACTLMTLEVRAFAGPSFNTLWIHLQSFTYWICLFVWMSALWVYEPNPAPLASADLLRDYDAFVSGTKAKVGEVRSSLGRVTRP